MKELQINFAFSSVNEQLRQFILHAAYQFASPRRTTSNWKFENDDSNRINSHSAIQFDFSPTRYIALEFDETARRYARALRSRCEGIRESEERADDSSIRFDRKNVADGDGEQINVKLLMKIIIETCTKSREEKAP